MNINYEIEKLIGFCLKENLISKWDVIESRNLLLDLLKVDGPYEGDVEVSDETPVNILNNILDYAYENKLIEENTITYRDLLSAKIMGILIPKSSTVIKEFYDNAKETGIESATDRFYNISQKSNYIMTDRIAKNLLWTSEGKYGDLQITVNLSKPEKDPKEIAKAKTMKSSNYPKCLLCVENVGYQGNLNHPARQNHRVIPLELQNEQWFFQYSPYVYYNEHCIIFKGEHSPMKLGRNTLERLVEFVDKFPHYFIGSNADLPIVGGSILTHDHYQGGRHVFPMEVAKIEKLYESSKYQNVKLATVNWPMTVIRLISRDKEQLINLAMDIFDKWKNYSDEENDIIAFTNETPHNTVTPIARRKGEDFELDIVLRNNRTSEEHPDGIFHPHKELHHIKKENIGLIEVMGLAVLPGRLDNELNKITQILSGEVEFCKESAILDNDLNKHISWIEKMLSENNDLSKEEAKLLVNKEVGRIFEEVLEHSGVFKKTEKGQLGLEKFINEVIM